MFIIWALAINAQHLIIGSDSISLKKFKEENKYGLENAGIDKTINSIIDFKLLQQFAREQKADTISYFKMQMDQKIKQVVEDKFYPKRLLDEVLKDYILNNQQERKIQMFFVTKTPEDKTNYKDIYQQVVSRKLSMKDAIAKYMKEKSEPIYMKTGFLNPELEKELKSMKVGGFTQLIDNEKVAMFAQYQQVRPSLGFMQFGTLSYPNDEKALEMKKNIQADLAAGKLFEEVTKKYGKTEIEINRGGLVSGSPTLPEEVYQQMTGKSEGFSTQPILIDNKWFIFHIYSLIPYKNEEKYRDFFKKEMMNSVYAQTLAEKLIQSLQKTEAYKEYPAFAETKKSYANFQSQKSAKKPLYQLGKSVFTTENLAQFITEKVKDIEKMKPEQWANFLDFKYKADVYQHYEKNITELPEIKQELAQYKQNLYADFIYSYWLKNEMDKHPEWLQQEFEKNKNNYILENRAKGRVAIIADDQYISEIKSEIKNIANWETYKKKFDNKLNDKNQILVYFEEGEMSANADVFTQHKVPFQKGIHRVKIGERTLVISIDDILPKRNMSFDEAKAQINEEVMDRKLQETIQKQKAKTKIIIEPAFMKDLEANFKK